MRWPPLRPATTLTALLSALALAALPSRPLPAQQRDSTMRDTTLDARFLPRDIARRVVEIHAGARLRATEQLEIASGRTVAGDVSVQNGPLIIGGQVTGSVLAINADVVLEPSARIGGDLLVIGGAVTGLSQARVDGETRVYRERTDVAREAEQRRERRATDEEEESDRWWGRWERRRRDDAWSDLHISAGAYNRVEGLPISIGPRLRQNVGAGQLRMDAYAVVRTGSTFRRDSNDIGYDLRGEARSGRRGGVAVGARLFDVVTPVEAWQLSDREVGLAAFLARRDYRDHFSRHGGSLYARAFAGPDADFTVTYSDERWRSPGEHNPFTLFRGGVDWRPNPTFDDGRFHVASTVLRVDTRNDEDHPWAGWYVVADVEYGRGHLTRLGPTPEGVRGSPITSCPNCVAAPDGAHTYTRGLLDLRRYNRLGPSSQLNLRGVLGGWIGGDFLPLQRRLSVDGPGTLPGFGFRRPRAGIDAGTCNDGSQPLLGSPALCERIALAQVEYRGDLYIGHFGDWSVMERDTGANWVVFADAGRGWLVREVPGELGLRRDELPGLSTFRTDIGAGLDFDMVGFYVAKAISASAEPPVFFVRLRHRF